MIDLNKISVDWLNKLSKEHRKADKIPEAFFYWYKIMNLEIKLNDRVYQFRGLMNFRQQT